MRVRQLRIAALCDTITGNILFFRKGRNMKKIIALVLCSCLLMAGVVSSCAEEAQGLVIPAGTAVIESEAFAGCEIVHVLTVLGQDAEIADDALDGSGITTIRCHRTAEQVIAFAQEKGLQIEYLEPDLIRIWVSGTVTGLTGRQVDAFLQQYPEYSGYEYEILGMSESSAVSDLQDWDVLPDIFCFAQDQLAAIRSMGLLGAVPASLAGNVRSRNDAGSVAASEAGGALLAYPMTADNSFFLFYDKSVIHDVSSLEGILADCEAAGKKFYMEVDSGWYQIAFFFGAGCELSFDISDSGECTGVSISYANENGLKAMKGLIRTIGSPAFENGSGVDGAANWAAIVSGTWDAEAAKQYLGVNYAAAKLPTIDGYQMKSFGGYKLMGVRPQDDAERSAFCHDLADWLTGEACQLDRCRDAGWQPTNLSAQQSSAIQGNEALKALAEQAAYAVPQGQIPSGYWDLASGLVREIMNGDLGGASDETLMQRLQQFEDAIRGLVDP